MRASNPTLDRLDRFTWSLAAGVLLGLSFPPYGLFPLAWVALVPLMVRWARARTLPQVARETYAAFLATTAVVAGWALLHPFPEKALASGVGLLLLPLPLAAAFTLAALVRARLGLAAGLASLAANLLAVEWLAAQGPTAFPLLALGNTQADAAPFYAIAEVGGVGLLSGWVIAVNLLLFLAVLAAPRPGLMPGPRSLAFLVAFAVAVAPAAYGDEWAAARPSPRGVVSVALVQPGTAAAAWASMTDGDRVDSLAAWSDALLREPGAPPDLLVWPEGALPVFGDAGKERRLYVRLGVWAAQRRAALLAGAHTTGRSAPAAGPAEAGAYRSSALLFAQGGVQEYDRMHLVPLLETVPLLGRDEVPPSAAPPPGEAARYAAGQRRTLLALGPHRFAAPIGAETLLGPHLARFAAEGADFFVAPAQTGWWSPAPAAAQHVRLSRLRAIETGRALLVASVEGPSALVLPDGSIQPLAVSGRRALLRVDVPLHDGTTPYVRYGDFVWRGSALVAGLLALVGLAAALARRTASVGARAPASARRRPSPLGATLVNA